MSFREHFSRATNAVISFVVDAGKWRRFGLFSYIVIPVLLSTTIAEIAEIGGAPTKPEFGTGYGMAAIVELSTWLTTLAGTVKFNPALGKDRIATAERTINITTKYLEITVF
jgi:hypothetical protein